MEASIVIVTYGQWALTEQCLRSLQAALGDRLGREWEIVIVDNNSPDETPQRLRDWSDRARVELLPENRNFAGGCNHGAELASGETLIFLNNDTEVPAGALEALVRQVGEPGVAAAGCRLLFPNGTSQHAGVAFIRNPAYGGIPFAQHVLHHQDQDMAATQASFEADCVTAACLSVRAEVFREVGGFDERFVNGLEDVDLCLKIRSKSHAVVYRGDITIIHHEGASRGRGQGLWATPEKLEIMRRNDELYAARWGHLLDQDDELAACVWDGRLQHSNARQATAVGHVGVVGQPEGIGPAGDEARAFLDVIEAHGAQPGAFTFPPVTLLPRLSPTHDARLRQAAGRDIPAGSPCICIPAGRHDALLQTVDAGARAVWRLADASTARDPGSLRPVWATCPRVRRELIASGYPADRVQVVPSPVPRAPQGAGGNGVLVVLPVHAPTLARSILQALRHLPDDVHVSLMPSVFRRGWGSAAMAELPGAEPLPPCSDEFRFARLAASADLVLACDPSDRFERRAIVAAGVGTPPLTLEPEGPAAHALGPEVVCHPGALGDAVRSRLSVPRQASRLRAASDRAAHDLDDALASLLTDAGGNA